MSKQVFEDFLRKHLDQKDFERVIHTFEEYLEALKNENSKVNLVSRETQARDYWSKHFLDSILLIRFLNFSKKIILDFGAGGGLPGIPLKIIFPDASVYLLDSRQKKVGSIRNIIKKLDLKRCFTIVSRLEDLQDNWADTFDIIVCRAVKILPEYKDKMFQLLKNEGRIYLYKSKKLDDIAQFENYKIYDVSHQSIGERKIIEIMRPK